MTRSAVRSTIIALLALSTLVLLFLANYRLVVFEEPYFRAVQRTRGVPETIAGYNTTEMLHLTVSYLKNERSALETEFFTENEKSHLADVKHLISGFNRAFFILTLIELLLLVALFRVTKPQSPARYVKQALLFSGIGVFAVVILVYGLASNFNALFVSFHEIFFTGNWMFPAESNMLALVPEQFFSDVFYRIILNTAMMAFLLLMFLAIMFLKQRIDMFKRQMKQDFERELIHTAPHEKEHSRHHQKAQKK